MRIPQGVTDVGLSARICVETYNFTCGILSDMATPENLQQVMARNVKTIRLRCGLTQGQLAAVATLHGLVWTRTNVTMIETGRKQIHFDEAVVLAAALDVSLADLAQPSGPEVAIETGVWSAGYLRSVIEGDKGYEGPEYRSAELTRFTQVATKTIGSISSQREALRQNLVDRWNLDPEISHGEMKRIAGWSDATDVSEAKWIEGRLRLGITPGEVMIASKQLWGRSFQEEHDARSLDRPGNAQQVKGRVTRELRKELGQRIEEAANIAASKESK